MTFDDRYIPLGGAKNFRDFGGYPTRCGNQVRRGALFRSDKLSELSEEDLAKLMPLGIRHICDLRRQKERAKDPSRWHEGETAMLHMPLIGEEGPTTLERIIKDPKASRDSQAARQIMIELYEKLVKSEQALNHYRQLFQLIADEAGVPVLIHCSGGKDRTGISCALILWTLGVDMEDILADFMLSQTLYGNRHDPAKISSQVFDTDGIGDWSPDALRPVFSVEPAYLETAFAHLQDSYGSADTFLKEALGLTDEEIEQVRKNLIAPR